MAEDLMQALVFDVDTKTNTLTQKPVPRELAPNEVLVKVSATGICGTDLHGMKGEFPLKKGGVVMGHEISGVVISVGTKVNHVKPGDRVAIDPNRDCGICCYCTRGKSNFCEILGIKENTGLFLDGGFADYVRVEAVQVHPLPETIDLETGFLAETMSCIVHGRDILGYLEPDARIGILGAGIIGVLWTALLHHEGHRNIFVTEPSPERRQAAASLGFEGVKVMTPKEASEDITISGEEGGLDLVLDCCGVAAAVQPALKWIRRGGTLMVFACAAPKENISLNLFDVYYKELKVIGSHINPRTISKSLGLMAAMKDKYLGFDKIGIKAYKLEDYEKCFSDLYSGKVTKAYFKF